MSRRVMSSFLFLGVMALLTTGCAHFKAFDITVSPDESIKNRTVAVDIVGINEADYPRWESYSMSKYWSPGDSLRNSPQVCKTILFDSSHGEAQSIKVDSKFWKDWQDYGAKYIFIMASLPGFKEDHPGNADVRRQIIPIDNAAYEGSTLGVGEVKLTVTDAGIRVLTPMKPKN